VHDGASDSRSAVATVSRERTRPNDRAQTSGTDYAENSGNEMNEENSHACDMVTREQDVGFWPYFRIRQAHLIAAAPHRAQSCRGVIGVVLTTFRGVEMSRMLTTRNKTKHESIARAGTGHNKPRMARKTTTAIPFGLLQCSQSVYEASRRFRAVRVPGVALIVRHTPFSS
jgi:hypothetical protein